MSEPIFELEPIVWSGDEIVNGQYISIIIRNYRAYVGWTVYHNDGFGMPESVIAKGGACRNLLQAKDEAFIYAELVLYG